MESGGLGKGAELIEKAEGALLAGSKRATE
jgi:hypothetical protein